MAIKEKYSVSGMSCAACSSRVNKAVSRLEGVRECSVNLLKNSMVVDYDESLINSSKIIAAVEHAGYGAALAAEGGEPQRRPAPQSGSDEFALLKKRFLWSLIFTLPVFYLSMAPMAGLPIPACFEGASQALGYALTLFILSAIVAFINFPYFKKGFVSLFHLSPNMDSLVALGAGASIVYGVYALYRMAYALGAGDLHTVMSLRHDLYFDGAATILTLITLGKSFEAKAKGKTKDAINKLIDLTPKKALLIENGEEREIKASEVQAGDVLLVKAGQAIPVDGVVLDGAGAADEALLTGESLPVDKKPGDKVVGASILKSGWLKMQAQKVGKDTALAQIIALVDEATSSKAPIAKLADNVAGIFVPAVIVIALVTFVVWLAVGSGVEFALTMAVSVLVVSCPCALGLATPTSIMVGTGLGARFGILIKTAEALEKVQAVDTVILDKTGTITCGKPEVKAAACAGGSQRFFDLVLSLEKLSTHPLALAAVGFAEAHGAKAQPVTSFELLEGQGLCGIMAGKEVVAGNQRLLEAFSIPHEKALSWARQREALGETVIYFALDKRVIGALSFADKIKNDSAAAIYKLKSLGLKVLMLTGDSYAAARHLKDEAGLDDFKAQVLPQYKAAAARELQQQGRQVAMVGDGINDAPALAQADVGIAIGAGTEVAVSAADVVLVKNSLMDVAGAIELSRVTLRNIKENLFWAFIYNIIGIPVAAGCYYAAFGLKLNPMLAALAMSLSSVFVVSNALRLRFFRPSVSSAGQHGTAAKPAVAAVEALPFEEQILNAASAGAASENSAMITGDEFMEKEIFIEGMMCQHCVKHVTKALEGVSGVSEVKVSLEEKKASLQAGSLVTDEMLIAAVTDAGYEVTKIEDAR